MQAALGVPGLIGVTVVAALGLFLLGGCALTTPGAKEERTMPQFRAGRQKLPGEGHRPRH
jgi:hypothetical protein